MSPETDAATPVPRAKLSNTVRRDNHRPGGARWNEVRVSKTELLLTWCSFCDLLYRYLHSHLHHPSDNNNNPLWLPTTPFGCVTDDGRHIPLGQSVTDLEPGACRICECGREGLNCMYGDCLAPMCVDYVRSGCCYRCPNGPNCRLPSGEIISGPVERDGMRCECPPQDRGLPGAPSASHTTAICTPRTTIPIVG
ncbi:uncharacterized protein LOC112564853 isoform X2 [Pomacea canaliculata]|uniref:uncharacterized protein LOC112564853 isoform X2 n=1 Tax=Pomacea canaliculata TaxID=400727 RepID=UPI000D731180|nr:uncharacterized protein LOC112564853 isoform X2 [Pomacea canaliculata]